MTEQELRAQITDEILSSIKSETVKNATIATVVCITVIVDEQGKPRSVCRFYLRNGVFIGEVPAENIVAAERQ